MQALAAAPLPFFFDSLFTLLYFFLKWTQLFTAVDNFVVWFLVFCCCLHHQQKFEFRVGLNKISSHLFQAVLSHNEV